jgi:hypothetical protein
MVVAGMRIVAGIIHVLPLSGVLGPERLTALYGLDFAEPNLVILMRHRAVLLGILGIVLIAAAFRPAWQPLALVLGFASPPISFRTCRPTPRRCRWRAPSAPTGWSTR